MAAGPTGGPPGGFDYNQWAAMNLGKSGGDSGEAMTPDELTKKSVDKFIQVALTKILGFPVNPDIEGKSAFAGLESPDGVGGGLSLKNVGLMGMVRDLPGGVLAQILKYFTRDLPNMGENPSTGADAGAGASGGDFGGGAASGAGGGDFSSAAMGQAGGFSSQSAAFDNMPDMRVSYGERFVSAEAFMGDLGNLRPSATPSAGATVSAGMEV